MRALLAMGLVLIFPFCVHAQTAEQTVLQMMIGTKKYETMKVTRLDECRFRVEGVRSTPTGEFAVINFSKMKDYVPSRLPSGVTLIRMTGDREFVLWRLRDPKLGDGQFSESYVADYEYDVSATETAALSIQELTAAEAHFRQQYCKR